MNVKHGHEETAEDILIEFEAGRKRIVVVDEQILRYIFWMRAKTEKIGGVCKQSRIHWDIP